MTVRPIIFSAPMVRALLAGTKTMTRRILKPSDAERLLCRRCGCSERDWKRGGCMCAEGQGDLQWTPCQPPRFAIGDLLWVRESVRTDEDENLDRGICYLADEEVRKVVDADDMSSAAFDAWWRLKAYRSNDPSLDGDKIVPPIHMPRWASRLTLAVTGVKVERLQDISEADALTEGINRDETLPENVHRCWIDLGHNTEGADWLTSWDARDVFRQLWWHINGPGAWEANPWVVALTFTVHRTNVHTFTTADSPLPTAEPT